MLPAPAGGQTPQAAVQREYQVKVAFVYNFLKFVSGPRLGPAEGTAPAGGDPNKSIVVGVVGQPPSPESFNALRGRSVGDKHVAVRFFEGFTTLKDAAGKTPQQHPQIAELRRCQVLFLCASEKSFLGRLLPSLQRDNLLLVGDTAGFLEAGGVINLLIEDKKVRFEINLAAAGREKLQVRSALQRLAVRTIDHDALDKPGDQQKQNPDQR